MGDKARAARAEAIEPGRKLGCHAISVEGRTEYDEERGGMEIGHLQVVYGEWPVESRLGARTAVGPG